MGVHEKIILLTTEKMKKIYSHKYHLATNQIRVNMQGF